MATRRLQYSLRALVLMALVLALAAGILWLRGGTLEPRALARPKHLTTEDPGIPDSGQQRQMIIAELKQLNSRLQAIESALRDGQYLVQTKPVAGDAGADDGGGP